MKEIPLIILILVLAFIVYLVLEGTSGLVAGAEIIKALRFDFGKNEEVVEENGETKDSGEEPKEDQPETDAPEAEEGTQDIPKEKIEEIEEKIEKIKETIENIEEIQEKAEKEPPYEEPSAFPFCPSCKIDEYPISPYQNKIKISIVREEGRNPSYIKLRINPNQNESINITGLTLRTRHGVFVIPKGVEKYTSSQNKKDIIIKESLYVYMVGEKSPLATEAFRTNNCLCYLENHKNIYPSTRCSYNRPEKEDIYHLHPVCQEYILDLRPFEKPNYSNNLAIATKNTCVKYINQNFNYTGCYNNYNKQEDFLRNYWYIYTGSDLVEPLHDTIYLLDQNGWLIDSYIY